jgi:hypothetical protein
MAYPLFRKVGSTLYYDTALTEEGGSFKPGWDFKPKSDYDSSPTGAKSLDELSEAMYNANEGFFLKKDLIGNRKLQIKLDNTEIINAYGFNSVSKEWTMFPLTSNMADNKSEVLVTGVLKYRDPTEVDSPEKFVYLYKYTNGGTTYTDVVIDQDEYELRPFPVFGARVPKRYIPGIHNLVNKRLSLKSGFKEKSVFKEYPTPSKKQLGLLNGTFGGVSPPRKLGKIKFIISGNSLPGNSKLAERIRGGSPPNTGAGGGANSKNPKLEGGSKTYKTRKHKRTRRHKVTTPRKWSTKRGTRRR